MLTKNSALFKSIVLASLIAIGVVISPLLRIEGMCPMAHLINIVCSVLLGPWYSLLCAVVIGVLRMVFMGIPPLALTGAVFGAFLSGVFYQLSKGKLICAVLGEVFGTGIIGAIVSYPIMAFLMGRTGLTWVFYVPMFIGGTLIGGTIAYIFLKALSKNGLLAKFQLSLGAKVYDHHSDKKNNVSCESE
ncbi:MAG: energy coupling factor transporter S component ThiW [Oscillospiraceae bacterium]